MLMLNVDLQRLGDPPSWADLADKVIYPARIERVAMFENYELGGPIRIAFLIQQSNGHFGREVLTESQLNNLAGILRGFRKRIDENPVQR